VDEWFLAKLDADRVSGARALAKELKREFGDLAGVCVGGGGGVASCDCCELPPSPLAPLLTLLVVCIDPRRLLPPSPSVRVTGQQSGSKRWPKDAG